MNNPYESKTNQDCRRDPFLGFKPKMVILDDDPIVTTVIREHIQTCYPIAEVRAYNEPVIKGGYDVYFVDNDFNGKRLASILVSQIREISPNALVVALSSTLDLDELRRLVNQGCNVVYNKRFPQKSQDAREVIDNYIKVLRENQGFQKRGRFIDLLGSLRSLLDQWNVRLNKNIPENITKNN